MEVKYFPTENICTDILNNPEQVIKFSKDIAARMDVSVDYDDDIERNKTHPLLLPIEK